VFTRRKHRVTSKGVKQSTPRQHSLWILNTVIQGSIVILAINGAFITFILAFTWQHREKQQHFEIEKRNLQKKGESIIKNIVDDYKYGIREIYDSWFSNNPDNIVKFFDNIVFSHPLILHYRNLQKTLSIILVILSPILKIAKKFGVRGSDVRKMALQARSTILGLAIILAVSPYTHIISKRSEQIFHPPLLSEIIFMFALFRATPPMAKFRRHKKQTGVSNSGALIEVEPVKSKEFKHDIIEWSMLYELVEFFPNWLVFPIEIKFACHDKLKFRRRARSIKSYSKMEQKIFETTKFACLSKEYQRKLQDVNDEYEGSKEELENITHEINKIEDATSKLSFFVRSAGRRVLKIFGSILGVTCIIAILSSLFIMSSISMTTSVPKILVYFPTLLLILAIFALLALVSIFLRAL